MNPNQDNFRTWSIINLDNYRHNIAEVRKFLKQNVAIMQIVKADAYGHGSIEIAREAEKLGIKWLGIANSDEGIILRLEELTQRILILSPSFPDEIDDIVKYSLTPSVSNLDFIHRLNRFAKKKGLKINVHLNFDTGMGRDGFLWESVNKVIDTLKGLHNIVIEGIFSHFSMSENTKSEFSSTQNKRYKYVLKQLKLAGIIPKYRHIANSAAVINFPESQYDIVRLGLLSYGVYTDQSLRKKIDLRPVMTFKTKIIIIKEFPAEFGISYNRTYKTKKKTKAAILPVGYGDGYNYLLSNIGKVIIHGKICKVIGRVTMDMIVVDISKVPEAKVGDEVILMGGSKYFHVTAEEMSTLYKGLSYETLCDLGRRAQRIFIKENKGKTVEPISRRTFIPQDFSDSKLEKIIQTSLNHRLNSNEIGNIVYQELLKHLLFKYSDKGINWKTNFIHTVKFSETKKEDKLSGEFYFVETKLSYNKIFSNEKFKIVCAQNIADLEKFFRSPEVEYRWLLDEKIDLFGSFKIDKVRINDVELKYNVRKNKNFSNLEIECYHPSLKKLLGEEVNFTIDTTTYYPRSKHQLTIYLVDLTKGMSLTFDYSSTTISHVDVVSVFAGREKYPQKIEKNGIISLQSKKNEWFFPNSGVSFVW